MLQIVAGRTFNKDTAFIYTDPKVVVGDFPSLFNGLSEYISRISEEERYNLFYTLAHHSGAAASFRPQRSKATFEVQTVLGFDIDDSDVSKAYEYLGVMAQVLGTTSDSLSMVCSGNGLQFLAQLKTPIRSIKYFEENKKYYNQICDNLDSAFRSAGLPGYADPVIFEPARLFRLPGTQNRKPGKASVASLIKYSDIHLDLNLGVISGVLEIEAQNVSPKEIRRNFPLPDFVEIVKECQFVARCGTNPEEVHEPNFFDLAGLMSQMPPDATIQHAGEAMNGEQYARYVFENASSSDSLKGSNFEEKWNQAGRYGVRKCSTINDRWAAGCKSCPHHEKIPTPLALKSPDHIGSAANGYWNVNREGSITNPNYSDLLKVYRSNSPYFFTPDGRLYIYNGTHFASTNSSQVKAWIEKTVRPSDNLKSHHRSEFLEKVKSCGYKDEEIMNRLMEDSIRGKINCKNGVIDVMTGKVLPHSPDFGFEYCLDYDYEPDQDSVVFMEWIATMMKNRKELVDSLLDFMAYILWPSYDDHVFVFLTGDGNNGKSTFINIIDRMLGTKNISSVNVSQLLNNRFAPSALDGKLINLSDEASGVNLGSEQLNVLKTLSAGGITFVEKKGEQGYSLRNKAKLIFNANEPPIFKETGTAVKRRLLVIPFDYKIKNPDPNIEKEILDDVPRIISQLVRRTRDIVQDNNGSFKVSRGGKTAAAAQDKLLFGMDYVMNWARDHLSSSDKNPESDMVTVDECYSQFKYWCIQAGITDYPNKPAFSSMLTRNYIPYSVGGTRTRRINGVMRRVYVHTKIVEFGGINEPQ